MSSSPSSASVRLWTSHLTALGCKMWGLNWANLENLSSSNVLWILSQSKGINQGDSSVLPVRWGKGQQVDTSGQCSWLENT